MKEPPLRTSCGGGSFVLRSAPERKVALGPALPTGNIDLNKDGARPFRPRFCILLRVMWGWWRRAFLRVFCNRRPLHTDVRAKIRARRCFSRIIGGVMGRQRLICRDIRGLWHFFVAPEALGYVEYSQKCTVLRGGPSLKKQPPRRSMHSTGRFMHIPD